MTQLTTETVMCMLTRVLPCQHSIRQTPNDREFLYYCADNMVVQWRYGAVASVFLLYPIICHRCQDDSRPPVDLISRETMHAHSDPSPQRPGGPEGRFVG